MSRPHLRALPGGGRYVIAALLFIGAAVAVFAPLVAHIHTSVLAAENSDARNTIRGIWLIHHLHSTPFTLERDPLNAAPEGTPLIPAVDIASPFQPLVLWAAVPIFGLIASFNLFMLAGFVLTGLAAFVLFDRLGFGFLPSLIGGFVVSFNPWTIERAVAGAPAFNHGWCLILLLGALIRLLTRPTYGSAALAGAAYASCFLVAAYFGLVGLAFVLAYLGMAVYRNHSSRGLWRETKLAALLAGVTVIPLLPALIVAVLDRKAVSQSLSNPVSQLARRGASPFASYLLPWDRNPLFGGVAHSLRPDDQLKEKVLFFGYVTIALAIVGVVVLLRRHGNLSLLQRTAMTLAAVTVPIAFVLSLPQYFTVFGTRVYTPTYVFGLFTTFYRVYARVGYALGISLALLAMATLSVLARRHRGGLLVAVLGSAIVIEFLPGVLSLTASAHPPAYDAWIARQPHGIVVHYPLPTDNELALILAGDEYYNQRFTVQPNFNLFGAGTGGTREEGIRLLARYLTDPLTPKILIAEGVRYVVVHDDIYRKLHQQPPTLGPPFKHVKTIGDARIYALEPRPDPHYLDKLLLRKAQTVADLEGLQFGTVTVGPEGFLGPERYHNVFGWRWMTQAGVLNVHNPYDHPMKFRLFAHAFSNSVPRTIEVDNVDGNKLSSFRVPTFERALALKPLLLEPGDTQLNLFADPEPQRLGLNDKRLGSIYLSPMRAVPVSTVSLRDQ